MICQRSHSPSGPWCKAICAGWLLRVALTGLCVTSVSAWPFENDGRYLPDWGSLDTRPTPTWYDQAKIGIFVHWGVFSVPSYVSEWFWWDWQGVPNKDIVNFMAKNYPPGWTYADFARSFRAEFFNASQWADLFRRAGARYVVLTSKHHEGYTLWPSATSFNWNSRDVGPNKDLVGELAKAIRASGDLRFGLYHSLFEWFNPLYLRDKANLFSTQNFVKAKVGPELIDIVNTYKPDVIWSDGDWEATPEYWNSTHFLAWLYNDSPVKHTVLVNDRWGIGTGGKHGDFYNYADRYNPGELKYHKWENAMTLDKSSWGYRRNMSSDDVYSLHELLIVMAETISCNGNLLINVGPRADGIIDPIFEERLLQLGQWLHSNGEAIYESRPWTVQHDRLNANVWYTSKYPMTVYAIVLALPTNDEVQLGALTSLSLGTNSVMTRLGDKQVLEYTANAQGVIIKVPPPLLRSLLPTSAFVIKIELRL
ncbi:alpha-L-fucosidase-like [Varroa destructor]|uniref:Putative alpha-L-fucosidase n=1 Tax=Varroa destructor TaxID=109461 RepID=A0A7M7IXK0_VARDE|nr:alpha-L-fucosidase-like [Varroa destructor]XP_022643959.1 alpha-L-fucosidase-like [Varroa destructor]XP_022643960.1 alpha-L-fucosidase-like [Varroa destructor]XP_022643962.1 alpha-L-fucosidase-like [Varroa destructor]XP_022643963.1 alpha-L-fucosidase-like [Varroa destructor]XP_022643964.1 alpha-L-fucosidase-like [Varroa destructor]XP_022643965.1 alpha-L-fucosidase-like [Varroa destructor]XP_022643966.1 alpha-L-fucosidase-like [Varroa destructor]XP_022643968.1 alpha-L-fucosidase-like [Var